MKQCQTDQDARLCEGNFIYGVRIQLDVGDRLAATIFYWLHYSDKNLKKIGFMLHKHF